MFNDLRELIKHAEEIGEYKRIEGADWNLEIGIIGDLLAESPNAPLLLFDKIKDYKPGYRVASNLTVTDRRVAAALGLPDVRGLELVKALRDKLADVKPIPPREVKTGPVKENVRIGDEVDLFEFPTPLWHDLDGGRYIGTGSITISRDPDTGYINLGTYRVQIYDKNTATISFTSPDRHAMRMAQKYWSKGQNFPVAVTCGQEPALYFASTSEIPYGTSEYDYAGGFKGEPIQVVRGVTTDLPIPATAEIVLEGEVVPPEVETRLEGPFGEWTGYYAGGARPMPAFRVKSILHRNNPIIQGNPTCRFPAVFTIGRCFQKAAVLWNALDRELPGVKGVWMVQEATEHAMVAVCLQQMYPGHAKQAAMLAASCNDINRDCTYVVVVDEDIDPSKISELLWALGTRTDPQNSIEIIRDCRASAMLTMLTSEQRKAEDFSHSIAIILACKPYKQIKEFPKAISTAPEKVQKVKEKWAHLL